MGEGCPLDPIIRRVGEMLSQQHRGELCPEFDEVAGHVCSSCQTLVRLFVRVSNACSRAYGCTTDHGCNSSAGLGT